MITPRKMNAVGIVVRDLERSLAWYKEKFGFEHLYDVSNGVIIGANGVELWVARVDVCVCVGGLGDADDAEVSEADLVRVKAEFAEDEDLVEIDHARYKSFITEDPDGHAIELFVNK